MGNDLTTEGDKLKKLKETFKKSNEMIKEIAEKKKANKEAEDAERK